MNREEWTDEGGDTWTRTLNGLTLRVFPDKHDEEEPWTWDVVAVDEWGDEEDVGLGGAASHEAAMAATEAAARAHGTDA